MMANKVTVVQNIREVSNMADRDVNLSEEEQALLRKIRFEREHLAREIQVCQFSRSIILEGVSTCTLSCCRN